MISRGNLKLIMFGLIIHCNAISCIPERDTPRDMIIRDLQKEFHHNERVVFEADVEGCRADYMVTDIKILKWSEADEGTAEAKVRFITHHVSSCLGGSGVGSGSMKRVGIMHYRKVDQGWKMVRFQELRARLVGVELPPEMQKLSDERFEESVRRNTEIVEEKLRESRTSNAWDSLPQ